MSSTYTFYLPVAIDMIASGVKDPKAFEVAKRICCTMGDYCQIQDDYLDCTIRFLHHFRAWVLRNLNIMIIHAL